MKAIVVRNDDLHTVRTPKGKCSIRPGRVEIPNLSERNNSKVMRCFFFKLLSLGFWSTYFDERTHGPHTLASDIESAHLPNGSREHRMEIVLRLMPAHLHSEAEDA